MPLLFINSETLVISGFSRPIKNEAMTLEKIKIDLPTGRVDILTQLEVAPLTKVWWDTRVKIICTYLLCFPFRR